MISVMMGALNDDAAAAGIDSFDTITEALVQRRNRALGECDFEEAVLLSHGIWRLNTLRNEFR